MSAIPKNNLRERLQKLGYDPNLAVIKKPELINIKHSTNETTYPSCSNLESDVQVATTDSKPPQILNLNIDEWSDFDEDE